MVMAYSHNSAHWYTEHAVSSLAMAVTIINSQSL